MSNTKRVSSWIAPALFAWAAGCASTPGAKPEDMSAQEHHEAAAQQEAEAARHEAKYDPNAEEQGYFPPHDELGTAGTYKYNPTAEHLRHAKTHRQHAADHEAAAKELEAFTEEECGRFTPEVRETCPLMGKVLSFEDIEEKPAGQGGPAQPAQKHGVRIRFAPDVDVEAVIAHMRCHLAFARKMGRKGMDHCPLYIEGVAIKSEPSAPAASMHGGKGHSATAGKADAADEKTVGSWRAAHKLRVERGAEAGTVELLVDDDAMLEELRKRVRAHMPQGD